MVGEFTAINYVTSSGERCIATKNNGVVTIQGNQNGVRQMQLDEFMSSFLKDQQNFALERTPNSDTFVAKGVNRTNNNSTTSIESLESLSRTLKYTKPSFFSNKQNLTGAGFNVEISPSWDGQSVTGQIDGKYVDLKIDRAAFDRFYEGRIKGYINGEEVNIGYNRKKGNLELDGLDNNAFNIKEKLSLLALNNINREKKMMWFMVPELAPIYLMNEKLGLI